MNEKKELIEMIKTAIDRVTEIMEHNQLETYADDNFYYNHDYKCRQVYNILCSILDEKEQKK